MTDLTTNLYETRKKCVFRVASVPDIGLLESLGVREGTQVTVQSRYAFGGPVLLRVEDTYSVALGKDVARRIAVRELAES